VYVALRKTPTQVQAIQASLRAAGADPFTTVVAAFDFEGPVQTMMAANAALVLAESLRVDTEGKATDVLMVWDELHAHIEAFGALHSALETGMPHEFLMAVRRVVYANMLQRCAHFTAGGSLSAFPIMHVPPGEPTELMSIADGHLKFTEALHREGQRPAIDLKASLSRTGSRARAKALHKLGSTLRGEVIQIEEEAMFSAMGGNPTPFEMKRQAMVQRVMHVMRHQGHLEVEEQVALLTAACNTCAAPVPLNILTASEGGLVACLRRDYGGLLEAVREANGQSDRVDADLLGAVVAWCGENSVEA